MKTPHRSREPDARLVPGAYVTRRDGSGGLFEVLGIQWERNFGLAGRHLGVAHMEDASSGEQVIRPPIMLLTDYRLVRSAGENDARTTRAHS